MEKIIGDPDLNSPRIVLLKVFAEKILSGPMNSNPQLPDHLQDFLELDYSLLSPIIKGKLFSNQPFHKLLEPHSTRGHDLIFFLLIATFSRLHINNFGLDSHIPQLERHTNPNHPPHLPAWVGVFPILALLEHSCAPNVTRIFCLEHRAGESHDLNSQLPEERPYSVKVVAVRDIQPGEYLGHSYVSLASSTCLSRERMLQAGKCFDKCGCAACVRLERGLLEGGFGGGDRGASLRETLIKLQEVAERAKR